MSAILYPGSFDPVTRGHIDVILRLRKNFDRVVVLVADSPRKNYFFNQVEREQLIRDSLLEVMKKKKLDGIEVKTSNKLTVDFAKQESIRLIARSVRTVGDWEYEYAMADANNKLSPEVETLFIMASAQYGFISSSLVREVAAFGGDTSAFVCDCVVKALKTRSKK